MRYIYFLFFTIFSLFACNMADQTEGTKPYAIGDQVFADLAETSFQYMQDFDFESWTDMMAEDVEYYFPDGDIDTRTKLVGKKAVLDWWRDWEKRTHIKSMVLSNRIVVPLETAPGKERPKLPGTYAICWITTKLEFENGTDISVRMNMDLHFNQDKKIDRIWSYYDRAGIIQAMGINILQPEKAVVSEK